MPLTRITSHPLHPLLWFSTSQMWFTLCNRHGCQGPWFVRGSFGHICMCCPQGRCHTGKTCLNIAYTHSLWHYLSSQASPNGIWLGKTKGHNHNMCRDDMGCARVCVYVHVQTRARRMSSLHTLWLWPLAFLDATTMQTDTVCIVTAFHVLCFRFHYLNKVLKSNCKHWPSFSEKHGVGTQHVMTCNSLDIWSRDHVGLITNSHSLLSSTV